MFVCLVYFVYGALHLYRMANGSLSTIPLVWFSNHDINFTLVRNVRSDPFFFQVYYTFYFDNSTSRDFCMKGITEEQAFRLIEKLKQEKRAKTTKLCPENRSYISEEMGRGTGPWNMEQPIFGNRRRMIPQIYNTYALQMLAVFEILAAPEHFTWYAESEQLKLCFEPFAQVLVSVSQKKGSYASTFCGRYRRSDDGGIQSYNYPIPIPVASNKTWKSFFFPSAKMQPLTLYQLSRRCILNNQDLRVQMAVLPPSIKEDFEHLNTLMSLFVDRHIFKL